LNFSSTRLIRRKRKSEEGKAAAYEWSALADDGGPAAAPWNITSNLRAPMRAVITALGLEPLDVNSITSNIAKVNVRRHKLSTH
jgi:hypothetical protein